MLGRSQSARVGKSISACSSVISGVPQGSVLGPTLFLLYINGVADIFTDLTVSLSLFADDLKLYTDYTVDATHSDLQVAVDRLIEWAKKWQLQISIPKCSAFRIDNTQWNLANEVANLTVITLTVMYCLLLITFVISVSITIVDLSTTNIFHTLSTVLLRDQC